MPHRWIPGLLVALAVLGAPVPAAQAQGRGDLGNLVFPKFTTLYSGPLVSTPVVDVLATVACSVVNVGPNPVTVTTYLCDAAGTCVIPASGCDQVSLQPGQTCDYSNVGVGFDQATYCRVDAVTFGLFRLRGTFQLMNGGDVSAATDLR